MAALLWGIQDGFLDVNNNAIAVSEYGDATDGSAAYTCVQMFSCFVLYLIASQLYNADPAYILYILSGALVVAYSSSMFFKFREDSDYIPIPVTGDGRLHLSIVKGTIVRPTRKRLTIESKTVSDGDFHKKIPTFTTIGETKNKRSKEPLI